MHEAAAFAGGRCRSYRDPTLGFVIDNGNHLLLSGNHEALDYLDRIGSRGTLHDPGAAVFDFSDLESGERWRLDLSEGRIPWWLFDRRKRVPGTALGEYFAPLGIFVKGSSATVGEAMRCEGPLYERLWRPMLTSALNTDPPESSAALTAALLRETLAAGGKACHPLFAGHGLANSFIDPALAFLAARGCPVRFGDRLKTLRFEGERAAGLDFDRTQQDLSADDSVILSVPPWIAKDLLPDLTTPEEFRSILNVHFQIAPPRGQPAILGVVNAAIEWLFAFPDRLSVTISNADRLIDRPRDELAAEIWREAAALTGLPASLPPWQIVKEKRATFAATPAQNAKRPDSRTRWGNVVLAGDWIQTGLPATIEGAVRSGYKAASLVLASGENAPSRRVMSPFAMNAALDHSQNPPSLETLERHISSAAKALLARQHEDGHWCFELEADATIPAEYVLLRHFRGEKPDLELERLIAVYLRRVQGDHGGWPLVHAGPFDMSASVKAYFALKMIGDDTEAPHMRRAREAILANGGAAKSNVFTRFLLALYEAIPWRGVPTMPVEIMLLPRWFPFHLDKVSYWARTVMVPLLVLQALKPRPANPRGITIPELFVAPPDTVREWPKGAHQAWLGVKIFGAIDWLLKRVEPYFPASLRRRAIGAAEAFVTERLNGEEGLGAIYPAMANAVLMFDALGYPPDHPHLITARQSIEKLLVVGEEEAYCQPCLSPVWDTALTAHALLEAGGEAGGEPVRAALDWLAPLQILDVKGDWAVQRPDVRPGGWAFQYANPHYPDTDDTAVVAMAMDRADRGGVTEAQDVHAPAIARAREWIEGLQSKNGAWAAFDADNTHSYLNHIPFADHGALLDPPTADVTARCVSMFAQLGETRETSPVLARGIDALLADQEKDGSWFGRWGMNYVYGTWSSLCALAIAGQDPQSEPMRRAVSWLERNQNPDGGWGESVTSYRLGYKNYEPAPSTASQTAWAVLGLMAAGEADHPAVARGIAYLAASQGEDGLWDEPFHTATGFPRVFYLRYHGYSKFFPLWAMARYRNLKRGNSRAPAFGM